MQFHPFYSSYIRYNQHIPHILRQKNFRPQIRVLKEELEEIEVSAPTEAETDEDLRSVSLEEADNFIEQKKRNCFSTALAIAAYILCPVVLIFLAGYSELATARISEDAAGGS